MKRSVIFMGSKPGAVVALEKLIEREWDIKAVVTSVSENATWIGGYSINDVAKTHGLNLHTNQDDMDFGKTDVDFVISYMYRNLVRKRTLDMAGTAALNFHAGLLPRFGGWAFYNVAILEEAAEYGVTCHHMDEGFDTGPLCFTKSFPIEPANETAFSLERKAQIAMVELFFEFVRAVESGADLPSIPQNENEMRYMTKEEFDVLKQIPEGADDKSIDRIARAFWYPPYECAYIEIQGKRLEVMPNVAKQDVAAVMHRDDLDVLKEVPW